VSRKAGDCGAARLVTADRAADRNSLIERTVERDLIPINGRLPGRDPWSPLASGVLP